MGLIESVDEKPFSLIERRKVLLRVRKPAKDLNGAIHIAWQIPPARVDSIEVRPVEELNCTSG